MSGCVECGRLAGRRRMTTYLHMDAIRRYRANPTAANAANLRTWRAEARALQLVRDAHEAVAHQRAEVAA